ncbi:response regulator transcription factor [Flocculibacter collagenilyticus]|uniref:response regulator transcription factor n=1 Tax=Flocculibacter collagenilyticus TaxID=2744479 RepID=UPI0018F37405|nr:response regulator transcription factor [Flocculibacter collagenilyticus]
MQRSGLHILVVEDQDAIASNIGEYFEPKGHVLDYATNGEQAISLVALNYYDVIILDIMLPKLDGLAVCERIRQRHPRHIPIIMLTARDSLEDKVVGFEKGADDYLTKPFALAELEMRCLALSRRHQLQTDTCIVIGELNIDRKKQTVTRKQQILNLSSMNYHILLVLAEAFPRVVSRTELCARLWGNDQTESDSLRSHIYQLRKILDKPFEFPMLKTVHGAGFSLVESKD